MLSAVDAAGTMFTKRLYGYFLVVVYSTIDTFALLDAPPNQISATGESFKAWTDKYFLPHTDGTYNSIDLWAARCSVMHAFSTVSDLSRSGKARQLQYYLADKDSPSAKHFVMINNQMDRGAHVAVHLGEIGDTFLKSLTMFHPVLLENVTTSEPHASRLKLVVQMYPL